jgi:hypothetical protein
VLHEAVSPNEGVMSSQLRRLLRLPDTADEIRSIAGAMKADLATDVFLGERANVPTVKSMDLTQYRVVAFATHRLVPGDLDGLTQPALALSAPEVAKIQGDGLDPWNRPGEKVTSSPATGSYQRTRSGHPKQHRIIKTRGHKRPPDRLTVPRSGGVRARGRWSEAARRSRRLLWARLR